MKIGIVTIWDNTNMGNRLQNYAMSYIFNNILGIEAVTIYSVPYKKPSLVQQIKEKIAVTACNKTPRFAAKWFDNDSLRRYSIVWWNSQISAQVFYETNEIPSEINNKYDYFVSGSDQIWNYNLFANKFHDYFLQFAASPKKIAVSASIGLNNIGDKWKDFFKNQLNEYKAISVREYRAKQIVEELTSHSAEVIADPVMVIDASEWRKVARTPKVDVKKKYILLYILGTISEAVNIKINQWSAEGDCIVYNLNEKKIPELFTSGPAEFLSLIDNASLVVTDSFHCSAFSVIFSTPFVVIERNDQLKDMSSRLDTLLQKYDLNDRRVENVIDAFNCDFNQTKKIIELEKKSFFDFLNKSISEIEERNYAAD